MIPLAYESQVISDSAGLINGDGVGDGCHVAFITCEGADIRYRFDGGTPTTGEGHRLVEGGDITLTEVEQIALFMAIAEDDDAILSITYGI